LKDKMKTIQKRFIEKKIININTTEYEIILRNSNVTDN